MTLSRTIAPVMAAVAFAAIAGCGNTSPTGGNAATGDKFSITGPAPVSFKPGERKDVSVKLTRADGFKQNVVLSADAPKGIHASFPQGVTVSKENAPNVGTEMKDGVTGKHTVKPSDPAEVSLILTADKDAAPGDFVVKVTGTPDGGTATTVDVKVTVTKP